MNDMPDLVGDLTPEDANFSKLIFKKDEEIEFLVKEFKVIDKGQIVLDCQVLTGEHAGKKYTLFIPDASTDMRRKQRAAFFFKTGIWTLEEVKAGPKMARLMGRKLRGKATAAKAGKDEGVMFQDIINLTDLGATSVDAQPGASAATVAAGQTSF